MKETKVSIVIPAYNEEGALKTSLEKMESMGMHEKYEVILVDDGSTDNTLQIMKESPFTVYSHNANKGYGASLKTGIRKSSGEKVIIINTR